MQINYVILAHKNPQQLKRLVQKLQTNEVNFYIHIDANVNAKPFKEELSLFQNIFFVSENLREQGTWGDIGIVKATIHCLQMIPKNQNKSYVVLLSGQDYPLQNNQQIKIQFEKNYGTNFLACFALPHPGWGGYGGLDRLKFYKFNISKQRKDLVQIPSLWCSHFYTKKTLVILFKNFKKLKLINLLQLVFPRKLNISIAPYGGGQWWAMPIETILIMLGYIQSHPEYISFHKYTLSPDEIFFHSLLMHLKNEIPNFKIMPSITYVNWERKNTPLPVTFTVKDFEELKKAAESKLFARKFDVELDEKILDQIDLKLLNV